MPYTKKTRDENEILWKRAADLVKDDKARAKLNLSAEFPHVSMHRIQHAISRALMKNRKTANKGGRPKKLPDQRTMRMQLCLYLAQRKKISSWAKVWGCSKSEAARRIIDEYPG